MISARWNAVSADAPRSPLSEAQDQLCWSCAPHGNLPAGLGVYHLWNTYGLTPKPDMIGKSWSGLDQPALATAWKHKTTSCRWLGISPCFTHVMAQSQGAPVQDRKGLYFLVRSSSHCHAEMVVDELMYPQSHGFPATNRGVVHEWRQPQPECPTSGWAVKTVALQLRE